MWGSNKHGQLGMNEQGGHPNYVDSYSSPIQVGSGTDWSDVSASDSLSLALKTNGTLWSWGYNDKGPLGQNNRTQYSSPVQIPGTTWSKIATETKSSAAIKTDGTLWSWGYNQNGALGQNSVNPAGRKSSPTQIGTDTDWHNIQASHANFIATKLV